MLTLILSLTLVAPRITQPAPVASSSAPGASPLTTKGDLYTFTTVDARLGVGADGLCLKPLAANPTGLEWGSCSAGGGLSYAEVAWASMGGF